MRQRLCNGGTAMLTLTDRAMGRRDFLRVGGIGAAGLTLANLLATKAIAGSDVVRDKSVIFLFLHGGPSQIETFDPKMTAPAGVRSTTGETSTALPGVTFGGTFTKLAPLAKQVSIVRSFRTGDGNHDIKPVVSKLSADANLGSLYARVAGTNHPTTGMPRNVALFPRAVEPSSQPAQEQFGKFWSTGALGSAYAPFMPGAGGAMQQDMQMNLPRERLDDRRELLANLDRLKRAFDVNAGAGLDRFQEQAFTTILGGVAKAFDLANEDPKIVANYDTAPLVRPDAISRKWNNYKYYVDHAQTVGRLLLLARRLCEAGCGFITVTTNFVWDMHADSNNAPCSEGMGYTARPLDHALAAFLQDVAARGLSEKILLVVCGEMGRSPRINAGGGRDHWGNLAPLLLAGGGLRMGQVVGQSTRDAGDPATTPITIANLNATILHTLLDVSQLRITRGVPDSILRIATEPVIEELC
jgi:hypothetical protein